MLMSRSIIRIIAIGTLIAHGYTHIFPRSPFRKIDPDIPSIVTSWQDAPEQRSVFRNSRLEEYALFKIFDENYFFAHHLPQDSITYRYQPHLAISGTTLQQCINHLIEEIHTGKKRFTYFTILKDSDFNYKKRIGLIVLRFNDYPFVVKVFMEHPQSLTDPYNKGFAPLCSFYSGGGINRHLVGFTRIKNLDYLREKIAADAYWSPRIDTPRKWFFFPEKSRWIKLVGSNINGKKELSTRLPGTYCIIADAIETDTKTSMFSKHDSKVCLGLCQFLNLAIDPHINNFMWEKGTNKLVVIDTEQFSTMMGFRKKAPFNSYLGWYCLLTEKIVSDVLFKSKSSLRSKQQPPILSL